MRQQVTTVLALPTWISFNAHVWQGLAQSTSETSDSSERQKHLRSNSWHKRLGSTSSVMQKNWDAFKNRNPNTMQQVNPPSMQYAFISQVACVYFSSRMRLILN